MEPEDSSSLLLPDDLNLNLTVCSLSAEECLSEGWSRLFYCTGLQVLQLHLTQFDLTLCCAI